MKTTRELLRDADPLGYEPGPSAQERRARRQAVLNTPRTEREVPRRRMMAMTIGAVVLAAIGAGSRYWPHAVVDVVAAVRFEVRLAEDSPGPGLRAAPVPGAGRTIYLHDTAVVTNDDIAQAQVAPGGSPSTYGVTVTFKPAGAEKIRSATQGHVGKPLAILVDGQIVIAPTVKSAITTSAVISGDYSKAEADRIVSGILGR
jgi:hypothetical protein